MTKLMWKTFSCVAVLLLAGCGVVWMEKPAADVAKPTGRVNVCAPELGPPFSYRKKVAVLAADILNAQDASDLPNLDNVWSQLLQQRLRDSGRLLVTDASDQHLYSGERQREWIVSLAKRLDVQFVVVPRFHNLHSSRAQIGSGEYVLSSLRAQRNIDTELLIFDGYHGGQIASISQSAQAEGSAGGVINPAGQPVLRGAFLETPLGQAMDSVLAAQVDGGVTEVACLPLMARVQKVMGGKFYIGTRAGSLLHPGDTLQLFRARGDGEAHLGAIEISEVYPESAVGIYRGEGNVPPFSDGLYVRAW